LALIDPSLAASAGSPTDGGDAALGRTRLYRAVIDVLVAARGRLPLTVVFDDAQWLDDETVRLLGVAVPELVACGVLVVIGFRSDETTTTESSLALLGDLRRDAVVRLQLRTLDVAEVGTVVRNLTDDEPEPAVVEAVFGRTRGNPLFVTELVRLLLSEHRLDVEGVHELLPTEVRSVLRRRLERVPEDALEVLVVVALIGRSAEFDLLVRATGMAEDTVFDACEAAVLTGLLIDEADGSGVFSLSHDLVRQTLAESVPPARRLRWHAKIGSAIQAQTPLSPERVLEVAEHLRQAAPVVGPGAAIPFLVRAADDALARLALRVATRILLDAMDLVHRFTDPLERAAATRQVQGRLTVAQIYNKGPIEVEGSRLLELRADDGRFPFDPEDPTEWWAAMTVAVALGQYERMALEAHAALRDDLPLDVAAVVRLELGLALFELGHFDHARDELEHAQALIGDGSTVRSVILSLTGGAVDVLLGMLAHFRGEEEAADRHLSLAERDAGDALPRLVVATFGGAWLASSRKDPATCARYAQACSQVATEMDYPAYVGMGEILAGWSRVMAGDLSGLPHLDEAYRGYIADGTLLHIPFFLTLCAEAHAFAGEPAQARALIQEARRISAQTGERSLGPRLSALAEQYAGPLAMSGAPET
jgi:tetratricopeptide (TPR) repeat protein